MQVNAYQLLRFISCSLTLIFASQQSIAAIQRESLWLGFTNQQHFSANKKWLFLQHGQVRIMNVPYPVRTILGENHVGYSLNSKQQFWLGYYVAGEDAFHKDTSEHRLLQQFSWRPVDSQQYKTRVSFRTRVEESAFSDRSQNLVTLRHLSAYESLQLYKGYINPLIYDEVFFHLNNPRYASTHFLSQNRLFLGVNAYQSKHAYWRIGYLNQFVAGNRDRKPEMNHILSMTYSFGDIKIGLPFDS